MTLTIHQEEDEQRQVKLTVEVSEDQVEKAMRQKARQLAQELKFPGFRRGKVPYRVVLQRLGREMVRAETVDDMAQSIFAEAMEDIELEPYGQPSFDDLQLEPLVLEFTIPLEPVVTLGSYRDLRKEIEPVVVSDEAVVSALEQVQSRHQTVEEVDRPIEQGDLVTLSGRGELVPLTADDGSESDEEETPKAIENGLIFDEEQVDLLMDGDKIYFGKSFVDNLIGLSAGDETTFNITLADDLEEETLSGREASFELSILNVKNRDLPPLDDELAKLEGDYISLAELKEKLQTNLQRQAEETAKEDLIESMVDDLLVDAELVYPPTSVEMEMDEMLESFKSQVTRSGWELEDYLKIQGSSEDSLREDFRENGEKRLQRRLVLRQLILAEKLKVEAADVNALVDERVGNYENEELREQMREFFLSGSGFDMISSEVLSNKLYERIQAIFSGTAPDLESLEVEDDAGLDEEE